MKINFFGRCILGTTIAILCLAGGPSFTNAHAQDQSAPPSGDATLPADIAPDSPLAQVVRLAQSGVDESVILAYINNSSTPFNLTPDQIIYLKDLGLPNDAVTAMIQRDQQLGATETPAPAPQTAAQPDTSEQPAEVTQNYFYDTLSPYGNWVDVEGCGLCWQPTVVIYDSGWQPYCDHGHWVYTDCGWYWLSDYSWGGTAFHYGRWFHDPHHGWCWWPDTVWGPSWVTWRYTDGYCGWAPLPPHTVYQAGAGIFYNGVAVSANFDFGLGVNLFTFVPTQNFCDPHPRTHRVAPAQVTQIYNRTTIINNFNVDGHSHAIINAGIPPERITAVTRTEIRPVSIRETSAPVTRGEQLGRDGQTLEINRPQFSASAAASLNNGIRPRPLATAGQNQPRPLIINGNGNNYNQRPETPAQNNYSQPDRNRNVPQEHTDVSTPVQRTAPDYYSTPAQPNSGYDPDKRVYSPKQQETVPQEQSHYSPPPAPVERQQNDEPRQDYSQPAQSAPANNSSSGSQQSGKQNWPGH